MAILVPPQSGQHVLFVGSTGSGKSELAQSIMQHAPRSFCIDTQDSLDRLDGRILKDPHALPGKLKRNDFILYKPDPVYRVGPDWWDYIFLCLSSSTSKKKPVPRWCYIDEIYHLGYGMNFPKQLPQAITTARQRKLSFLISTQRPKQIPLPVITEVAYIYVFYLARYEDRKTIAEYSRDDKRAAMKALDSLKNDFSFIQINIRTGIWEVFPPVDIQKQNFKEVTK